MVNTNNPNLDLFIKMVREINKEELEFYLEKSWDYDKIKTIAIIFNSRDRINGKKEKKISNYSMNWLKKNHNSIYKKNIITYINNYGCWNDLNFIIKNNKKNNYEYKLFAEQLKKDIEILNNDDNDNNHKNISLCSKWVISPNDSNVIKIARHLFNNDLIKYQERYRKEIIKPLRTHLDLIETKLCNKNYQEINYKKIPSKALSMYVKTFKKWDNDKYENYLEDVRNKKVPMKINGLLPHEIIKNYLKSNLNEVDETLELQWKTFIDNFKNESYENYEDIIPIVDVSGSMFSGNDNSIKPIFVSVALGLFLSELNRNDLHNKIITFSESPKFIEIKGNNLRDRIKSILEAPFGLNTNFLKIADLIINNSIYHKKIICFTDMQFDRCYDNYNYSLEDIHHLFMNKFTNNDYEKPLLIYWNLNGIYNDCPINVDLENTSIISGFSEQLLKIIFKSNDITPINLMEEILKPYYNNILI